jgi:hypothetical protein
MSASVQLLAAGIQYDTFEAFLHLLRTSAELRAAYNAMKASWNGRPMAAYRLAKQAFMERALSGRETTDTNG